MTGAAKKITETTSHKIKEIPKIGKMAELDRDLVKDVSAAIEKHNIKSYRLFSMLGHILALQEFEPELAKKYFERLG